MQELNLSFNSKKALCVQVGEDAGHEITALLEALIHKVEELERKKVDVMPIVPAALAQQRRPIQKAA